MMNPLLLNQFPNLKNMVISSALQLETAPIANAVSRINSSPPSSQSWIRCQMFRTIYNRSPFLLRMNSPNCSYTLRSIGDVRNLSRSYSSFIRSARHVAA